MQGKSIDHRAFILIYFPSLNLLQLHLCYYCSEQQSFVTQQTGQVTNIRDLTYHQRHGPRSSSARHSPGQSQEALRKLSSCRGKSRKWLMDTMVI